MGTKIDMQPKSALIIALTMSTTVYADCYVRSAMTSKTAVSITSIADVRPLVVPISDTQNKCIVNFRAQVNGQWITAEGENIGPKNQSEAILCKGAMDQGRTQILSRADGNRIAMEQNMVCTDQPIAQIRKVNIGDHLQESEVLPHPNFPKQFVYRTSACRWFIEPEVHPGDLLQRQGIICRLHDNEWQVVDKW